ncbi:hypothetical protein LshimejAT787_1500550 [Lyophyllum shimeji]|uniref:Uncharacterized protein n=1 Tax=Lyophyllum shimeji TaxID=47721 RepID=A0A9P3UV76_LYOSH|nr:hypothetical protein LshimejAT787_1500550 [Lyophyllum shimeji]
MAGSKNSDPDLNPANPWAQPARVTRTRAIPGGGGGGGVGLTNIRKEDPGKLSQVGYNAGQLDRPAFHWARNLAPRKRDATAVAQMDVKSSSVFALLWQMVRSRLPEEVINDFDTFLTQLGIRRMDGSGQMASKGSSGTYSVVLGCKGDP